MIIYLDHYRKSNEMCSADRDGYCDRSSYDEEILSGHWMKAERLMQSLNVNWNQAIRIINLQSNKSNRKPSPKIPKDFSGVDVNTTMLDHAYALTTRF